jgi:ATP-dependent DNA ligase
VGEQDVDDAILDGEVITPYETAPRVLASSGLLQRTQKPGYIAFDLLGSIGADFRSLPFSERRRLEGILPRAPEIVFTALSVQGKGKAQVTAQTRLEAG